MFLDEAEITAIGGGGGNGCASFRREKYVPHGGPDGGDGGDGGSVHLEADAGLNTLQHLAGKHHWRARRGAHGMGKKRHGKRGADVVVRVPAGTIVRDADHGTLLKDLVEAGQRVCVAAGGKGGRGNARFVSSVNQAPRRADPGEGGQVRRLALELKLIADVGLLGNPNAGKSTLLRRLSSARPKVADYPFTTLEPVLGIVELSGGRRFVMADIPGLIAGAHRGAGLGGAFLRHVERTRVLLHMLDICPPEGEPAEHFRSVNQELAKYSPALAEKTQLVVANKIDLTDSARNLRAFRGAIDADVAAISAVTGKGLGDLTERIWRTLHPQ